MSLILETFGMGNWHQNVKGITQSWQNRHYFLSKFNSVPSSAWSSLALYLFFNSPVQLYVSKVCVSHQVCDRNDTSERPLQWARRKKQPLKSESRIARGHGSPITHFTFHACSKDSLVFPKGKRKSLLGRCFAVGEETDEHMAEFLE
jgi:hypothetical protein